MLRRLPVVALAATGLILMATSIATANEPLRFTDSWGGSGPSPHRHRNDFCAHHQILPGHSRSVFVDGGPQGDHFTGTVYCSPIYTVHPNTTGPWNDGHWISIPCPSNERPMNGGAGFDSTLGRLPAQELGSADPSSRGVAPRGAPSGLSRSA